MKKIVGWKTKGMNQDLSVSAFSQEFTFENINLRLSTNDGNTQMSWVNEKGTKEIKKLSIIIPKVFNGGTSEGTTNQLDGIPIGTAVLNEYIVIFTHADSTDTIYRLNYAEDSTSTDPKIEGIILYQGNLGFDIKYPIEALVSYESKAVQKVYWTDDLNQPRVINITDEDKIDKYTDNSFDFVKKMKLNETVTVEKKFGISGVFAPGVIQYAFTYFNMYGQETNIFYTTPLLYVSHKERGGSPEDKIENAFKITVKNVDESFDYLRIYSIQRTSINATPICKRVQDIAIADLVRDGIEKYYVASSQPKAYWKGAERNPAFVLNDVTVFGVKTNCKVFPYQSPNYIDYIDVGTYRINFGPDTTSNSSKIIVTDLITAEGKTGYFVFQTSNLQTFEREDIYVYEPDGIPGGKKASYTDVGTSGNTVDPTELLYKGGETIQVATMDSKDNTLFMGNLRLKRDNLDKTLRERIKEGVSLKDSTRSFFPTEVSNSIYKYHNQLNSRKSTSESSPSVPCSGFMYGNYYRCGVQFQHETGKWSEPIWINDFKINNFPFDSSTYISVPTIKGTLTNNNIDSTNSTSKKLLSLLQEAGYVRMRPIVVFPELTDREVICQGVIAPTMYSSKNRANNTLYAQSSWFFRPYTGDIDLGSDVVIAPLSKHGATPYSDNGVGNNGIESNWPPDKAPYNPQNIRRVEIEGCFDSESQLKIDRLTRTLHSPDIEFDDQLLLLDYTKTKYQYVGEVTCKKTLSSIDIETESPTISNKGMGFEGHSELFDGKEGGAKGIVSGLFYDDWIVDDNDDDYLEQYSLVHSSAKWLVYPWQANGSLNNDITRSTKLGTATAVLKKKVISNLRYFDTQLSNSSTTKDFEDSSPQIFNSNESTIVRFKYSSSSDGIYMGNVDTALVPDEFDGKYFAFDGIEYKSGYSPDGWNYPYEVNTPFDSTSWMKTFRGKSGDGSFPPSGSYASIRGWYDDAHTYGGFPAISEFSKNSWFWSNNFMGGGGIGNRYDDLNLKRTSIRMKYKSTPHLICKFPRDYSIGTIVNPLDESDNTLLIVDVKKATDETTRFGGTSLDALKENVWLPCGEPVRLDAVSNSQLEFEYSYGDTYFQRWDCLKTYAYTQEDINQVVEIGSFMLETHVNIDGRYDRNRGQQNNLNMSPQNFNLLNPVYSQKDNFFNYRIMDDEYYKNTSFPNQITWSKTKESGADVDLWTNVTLASILELDGDKGKITELIRFNDQLLCFQDKGLSQVLYNENTQISTTEGVPIEIANSGKVQGKRYISGTIGCSNKWSVVDTPLGIYFMDSNNKGIYRFSGQLENISIAGGMNAWCKNNIPSSDVDWDPVGFNNFVSYYDKLNQDILFINKNTALAFNEKFGTFTSFYNYGNAPFFCSLGDKGIWVNVDTKEGDGVYRLWEHQSGNYCEFFGDAYGYSMTLIGNPEPQMDKIFTNLEFRATVETDGSVDEYNQFVPLLPFDSLEAWNEYQHGEAYLENMRGRDAFKHHTEYGNASLKRKFRIWRCDIPRDNYEFLTQPIMHNPPTEEDIEAMNKYLEWLNSENSKGIFRHSRRPQDRMRNPWLYLKLLRNPSDDPVVRPLNKTEVHDMLMTYYV